MEKNQEMGWNWVKFGKHRPKLGSTRHYLKMKDLHVWKKVCFKYVHHSIVIIQQNWKQIKWS